MKGGGKNTSPGVISSI